MHFASGIIASFLFVCSMTGTYAGFPMENEEDVLALSEQIVLSASNTGVVDGPQIAADGSFDIIVKYKNDRGRQAILRAAKDGAIEVDFSTRKMVAIKVRNVDALIQLENNRHIDLVELDFQVHTLEHTRGPTISTEEHRRLIEQTPWGITRVNLSGIPTDAPFKPRICVVDTGYGVGHSDLPTSSVQGFSPYLSQQWDDDGHGHGSHCAGTIGAIGGNNIGVTSVNPDPDSFTFYIGKGLSNSGSGSSSGVSAAIDACVSDGANIISMSLGSSSASTAIMESVQAAYDAGALIIAAAGNNGDSSFGYPASFPEVMSVGATNSADGIASFSQHNSQVEISAPGVAVRSTVPPNGYATWSGTSMATPHVAGVAARVWAHFEECTNHQIRTILIRSAQDQGVAGCDDFFGHGIVDARAAYDLLSTYGCELAGGQTPEPRRSGAEGGCLQSFSPLPPLTSAPVTQAPVTQAPATESPVTITPVTEAPVTLAPATDAPVTAAPVSSPQGNCPGEHVLEIEVITDIYPGETRYQVRRNGRVIRYVGFSASNRTYSINECYSEGGDYSVVLIDTFRDGIFSPGGWEVFWNGEEIYDGPGPIGYWGIRFDVSDSLE